MKTAVDATTVSVSYTFVMPIGSFQSEIEFCGVYCTLHNSTLGILRLLAASFSSRCQRASVHLILEYQCVTSVFQFKCANKIEEVNCGLFNLVLNFLFRSRTVHLTIRYSRVHFRFREQLCHELHCIYFVLFGHLFHSSECVRGGFNYLVLFF